MSSIIKVGGGTSHNHDNYDILKEFSEANSVLLYKGKPIVAGESSTHESIRINTESGVHGLRYYNSKLQYFDNVWKDAAEISKEISLSTANNNALIKDTTGYYVPAFCISQKTNNAIEKYSDGYYVPTIPANNATIDDINELEDEITNKLTEQNQKFNERYDIVTAKLLEITSNTTKSKVHEFKGNNPISLDSVIDIATLYSLSNNVILNLEFMLKNVSGTDSLEIKILENGVTTLEDILTKSEVQRYKLPNIPTIEIFIKGDYQLFLYVTYV